MLGYVTNRVHSLAATIAMKNIQRGLGSAVSGLSDQKYEKSLAYFRFWFGIGQTYSQVPPDLIFDVICDCRATGHSRGSDFIYPNAHQVLRFVSDVESDTILGLHSAGLRSRFCTRILRDFFDTNLETMHNGCNAPERFYMDANLIAHGINLGYIEEDAIRNHILQSLLSHHELYGHQAIALAILFKMAGATFEAYVDPAVVDRFFELLKNHREFLRNHRVELTRASAFSTQGFWNH